MKELKSTVSSTLLLQVWSHGSDALILQVNQGLTVYGNKGSTDQHAWVSFIHVVRQSKNGDVYATVVWYFGFHFSYIQQLREGVHNFFATFIEVLRDRPPGHDWELEPGVTCGDYLFGMLQVWFKNLLFTLYTHTLYLDLSYPALMSWFEFSAGNKICFICKR